MRVRQQALDKLHNELTAERLGGLARAGEILSAHLAELSSLRALIETLSGEERAAAVAAYKSLREQAETRRWYLVVQREAIGIYSHDDLEAIYPVPPVIDR